MILNKFSLGKALLIFALEMIGILRKGKIINLVRILNLTFLKILDNLKKFLDFNFECFQPARTIFLVCLFLPIF